MIKFSHYYMVGMLIFLTAPAIAQTNLQKPDLGETPKVEQIRMQMFYRQSGKLSDDILVDPQWAGWNVIIGAGSAEEPTDDMLVTVKVRAYNNYPVAGPISIIARDGDGKVVGKYKRNQASTGEEGSAWIPLWLRGIGCAGMLTITATAGASKMVRSQQFMCGE